MTASTPTNASRWRRALGPVIATTVTMALAVGAVAPAWGAGERTSDPGTTVIVSRSTGNVASDGDSDGAAVSADGTTVAFTTQATTLVAQTVNPGQVVVRDLDTQVTTLVSRATAAGDPANGGSSEPTVSGDGRLVAYRSLANNLVAGDGNDKADIFLRNRSTGLTTRVSVATDGTESNGDSAAPAISASGRYIAFESVATTLHPDATGESQIYVHDRKEGTTELVSRSTAGAVGDNPSYAPTITGNGRYIAFASTASNFRAGVGTDRLHIYVHDRSTGTTSLVTDEPSGTVVANDDSFAPSISANGRLIALETQSTNLGDVDSPFGDDVIVHDRNSDTFTTASVDTAGTGTNGGSAKPSISADGRRVAFEATGNDLVAGDANDTTDIFLRDLVDAETQRVSVESDGTEAGGYSRGASTSWNGAATAFHSVATDLITGDLNGKQDVFARILDALDFCAERFSDVESGHPFCLEIEWLAESGISGGFPDGTFRPDGPLTRQAMAAFLYRAAGEPAFDPPIAPTFSDVPGSHPFFLEIEWLAASGITGGFPDGTYRPTNLVTRQAIAAFLYRAAGEPPLVGFAPSFTDVGDEHPFRTEIEWLASSGVTAGFVDGTFRPGVSLTRQAMAAFQQRYLLVGLAPT